MADVEKVIKGLECWLIDAPGCPDEYCPYMGGMALCNEKAILKDAVELLKEQEPKPIVYTDNPYTGLPVAHCPKCGEHIQLYAYGNGAEQNYCPYCGQAVKW